VHRAKTASQVKCNTKGRQIKNVQKTHALGENINKNTRDNIKKKLQL